MCLDNLAQKYNKTSSRIHIGFKVFEVWDDEDEATSDDLFFPFFGMTGTPVGRERRVERGSWLKATSYRADPKWEVRCFGTPHTYKPGFHIYKKLKDAERASKELSFTTKVVKVFFRVVTARGFERVPHFAISAKYNIEVLVAQELYVPKSQKRKAKKRENTRKSRLVSRAGG